VDNKTEVIIGGQTITLKSAENNEYVQKLASYVDRKLVQVKKMNAHLSTHERLMTVYLAINIADDYFKAQERYAKQGGKQASNLLALDRLKEENEILKEKVEELQNELKKSKDELDEYIQNFENEKVKEQR
jgi:cell division protein ZapA